jgi:carboxylesterase type B
LPAEKIQKLPVLFFIHGGRLLVGYGDYYKPDYYIRHNVILVTVNYRLHILGFLCLDIPEAPGNAGIKDCAMALKWVRNNISSFNGDSNNITVIGESAGAAIAGTFLMTKSMTGLYDKVIMQSGNNVADVFFHIQDHVAIAKCIASSLGREINDERALYEFLVNVPVEELTEAYMVTEMQKSQYVISPTLLPVVEKEFEGVDRFISEPPKDSLRFNRFAKVPMIVGTNLLEGAIFLRRDNGGVLYEEDLKYLIPPGLYLSESSPRALRIVEKIKHFYFNDKNLEKCSPVENARLLSESLFQRDIVLYAESVARNNNKLYSYSFQYEGSLNIGVMKKLGIKGTTHGDSVQYQFYNKNKHGKCTERDRDIIDFFSESWCNFAKCG